jgi:PAS domain S-box-containing protein
MPVTEPHESAGPPAAPSAEAELREGEERFRQLAEHIDAVFWVTDVVTRGVLYLSPAVERLWGFDREAFYRDPQLWAHSVHPDDRPRAERAFRERARHASFDEIYRMITPARGVRWIRDRGFPITDAGGRVYRVGGIAEDITDRVATEAELSRLFTEAERANRAKDAFLAMLGHELRNPLGAIRSAIGVLDLPDAAPETASAAREVLRRQSDHLARLVDDLLDLSRVTRGQVSLRRRPVNLGAAVEAALATLGTAGLTRAHRVHLAVEAVWAEVDPTRFEQIVGNLVTNAVKFTPEGGAIEVRVERAERAAQLTVRDTGRGISPEALPQIFDLFFQAQPDHVARRGGLGIGLTLVRHLVELHGGTVAAESAGPDAGTLFTLRLPLIEAPAPAAPAAPAPSPTRARRILVVEDNPDGREMLTMLLRLSGHDVREAEDGPAALALLAREPVDVALLDIGLPGLSGYELARQIRALPGGTSLRLVALTGFGRPEDQQRVKDAGFDAHMVKPVDPARLSALIDETR